MRAARRPLDPDSAELILFGMSLRIRRKPPAGLETINSGEPWSAMDLADLDEFLNQRLRNISAARSTRSSARSPTLSTEMRLRPIRPARWIEPRQPSTASKPPSGPGWVHEIKHDGFRMMARRDGCSPATAITGASYLLAKKRASGPRRPMSRAPVAACPSPRR
jgi:hypothetical protein